MATGGEDKKKVVLLGGSGMLGSMIAHVLESEPDFNISITVRNKELIPSLPRSDWQILDAEKATVSALSSLIKNADWVINAIGIIKPYIHDDNAAETERAIRVNALFPHLLAQAAQKAKTQVIQIATDCVYSGKSGHYKEGDVHDALDVYGKTKSLGEVTSPVMHHLRCSIIGPEPKGKVSLLEWFLKQEQGASVNGFTNHEWNGVTTYHYAQLCVGIIKNNLEVAHSQHIVPSGTITKADLLTCFAKNYHRPDITINPVAAPTVIDRTLDTENTELNAKLWQAAGYSTPPTVETMVEELAAQSVQETT